MSNSCATTPSATTAAATSTKMNEDCSQCMEWLRAALTTTKSNSKTLSLQQQRQQQQQGRTIQLLRSMGAQQFIFDDVTLNNTVLDNDLDTESVATTATTTTAALPRTPDPMSPTNANAQNDIGKNSVTVIINSSNGRKNSKVKNTTQQQHKVHCQEPISTSSSSCTSPTSTLLKEVNHVQQQVQLNYPFSPFAPLVSPITALPPPITTRITSSPITNLLFCRNTNNVHFNDKDNSYNKGFNTMENIITKSENTRSSSSNNNICNTDNSTTTFTNSRDEIIGTSVAAAMQPPHLFHKNKANQQHQEEMQISCNYCGSSGPEGMARAYVKGPNPIGIVLCANRLKNIQEVHEVLIHELIHVYDVRMKGLDLRQCDQLAYSEVRAAREAECYDASRFTKSHCVKDKAIMATKNMFPQDGKRCVKAVFDCAFKDHAPFPSSSAAFRLSNRKNSSLSHLSPASFKSSASQSKQRTSPPPFVVVGRRSEARSPSYASKK